MVAIPSLVVGLLLLTGTAIAGGGLAPSKAPTISIGTHYFGNTAHEENEGHRPVDLWHLPPVLSQDLITIAWTSVNKLNGLCLAEDVDDYSWAESGKFCGASNEQYVSGSGSARTQFTVGNPSGNAYLEFVGDCCNENGTEYDDGEPYDFTVESIQHVIGVNLQTLYRMNRVATLTASAVLSDGSPVPDGTAFVLRAAWPGGGIAHFTGSSVGGTIGFAVELPPQAQGQIVALTVRRQPDAQFQLSKSPTQRVLVAAPQRHRHHRHHHHHHRHRHHKH